LIAACVYSLPLPAAGTSNLLYPPPEHRYRDLVSISGLLVTTVSSRHIHRKYTYIDIPALEVSFFLVRFLGASPKYFTDTIHKIPGVPSILSARKVPRPACQPTLFPLFLLLSAKSPSSVSCPARPSSKKHFHLYLYSPSADRSAEFWFDKPAFFGKPPGYLSKVVPTLVAQPHHKPGRPCPPRLLREQSYQAGFTAHLCAAQPPALAPSYCEPQFSKA
jgi:hypothetical protein